MRWNIWNTYTTFFWREEREMSIKIPNYVKYKHAVFFILNVFFFNFNLMNFSVNVVYSIHRGEVLYLCAQLAVLYTNNCLLILIYYRLGQNLLIINKYHHSIHYYLVEYTLHIMYIYVHWYMFNSWQNRPTSSERCNLNKCSFPYG